MCSGEIPGYTEKSVINAPGGVIFSKLGASIKTPYYFHVATLKSVKYIPGFHSVGQISYKFMLLCFL